MFKKSGIGEPNPKVVLSVKEDKLLSSVKERTTNPKWNENFYFFIENPQNESLLCKIEDDKTKKVISTVEINLKEILNEENLSFDRTFNANTLLTDYQPKLCVKLTLYVRVIFRLNQILIFLS